ncbi:MAG: S1 family peptidase, partial [Actinomycetota bacterium]|nr:S1 family peptidase [Actinomycetota bacterium]
SLADLRARQAAMIEDRAHARAGLLLLPGADGGRYDIWIDEPANALVVRLENGSPAAAAAFRGRYGDDVVVQSGPIAQPDDCTRSDCRYDLRGGLMVYSDTGSCTSAFTVRRNWNDAKNLSSAAHCPDPWRRHGGQKYGEVGEQQQYGKVDFERHTVADNGFDAKPWIYVDQDHKSRDVLDRGQYSGLQVGDEVCKSGITTYKTCGNVLSKTFSPSYVDNGNDFIQAKYCSEPGDSGAPVFIGNKALGINSGSTSGCGQPTDYAIFGHIEFAQEALNVRVMLASP